MKNVVADFLADIIFALQNRQQSIVSMVPIPTNPQGERRSFSHNRCCWVSVRDGGMLVIQKTSLYLPHWAHSAGMYGSIVLTEK